MAARWCASGTSRSARPDRTPGPRTARGGLPGGGNAERGRVADPGGARWHHGARRVGPGRVPLPGDGGLGRGRGSHRGAEPGSAPDAPAVRRPGAWHHRGAAGGHRRALGRHSGRCARLDRRRPDRVDGGFRRRPAVAGRQPPATHRRHRGTGHPGGPPGARGRGYRRRHRAVHGLGGGPHRCGLVDLWVRGPSKGHPGARGSYWPARRRHGTPDNRGRSDRRDSGCRT